MATGLPFRRKSDLSHLVEKEKPIAKKTLKHLWASRGLYLPVSGVAFLAFQYLHVIHAYEDYRDCLQNDLANYRRLITGDAVVLEPPLKTGYTCAELDSKYEHREFPLILGREN